MYHTGATFEIAYKGVVYDVSVKRTDKPPKLSRSKRASRTVKADELITEECVECGSLRINGVCMNVKCPSVLSRRTTEPL